MSDTNLSFDRMRGMLMRAAEIRDSEQQQIFDSLDEIHARLAALDALGTVRKRLTELPDRTEVSVLAERLDETVAKLDTQDATLGAITRAIESLPDKLAKPFAQLDGRLDGMGGRLEGVSGRMDGLDDRLGGLHKRLDDLDNRLDRHEMRLDAMPNAVATPIKERIDGVERKVKRAARRGHALASRRPARACGTCWATPASACTAGWRTCRRARPSTRRPRSTRSPSGWTRSPRGSSRSASGSTRSRTAWTASWASSAARSTRSSASWTRRCAPARTPTSVTELVAKANEESERRSAGQLDEAMATFAELILGRGAQYQQQPAPPPAAPGAAPLDPLQVGGEDQPERLVGRGRRHRRSGRVGHQDTTRTPRLLPHGSRGVRLCRGRPPDRRRRHVVRRRRRVGQRSGSVHRLLTDGRLLISPDGRHCVLRATPPLGVTPRVAGSRPS